MLVSEVMTSPVETIGITTPAQEIAALLAKANISGVPVVDAKGGLVGIVSEVDLVLHTTQGSGTTGRWWLAGLSSPDAMAHAFAKAHGRIAADLMTRHVVTVRHDATLAEVAEALTVHGVKRLPVTRNGTLVGIVTRRDLCPNLCPIWGAARPHHRKCPSPEGLTRANGAGALARRKLHQCPR